MKYNILFKGLSYTICVMIATLIVSCNDQIDYKKPLVKEVKITTKGGRLVFTSPEELNLEIDKLIEEKSFNPNLTEFRSSSEEFVSLRDKIIQNTLDSLTSDQIKEAKAEGLELNPEDSIISDPYFCSLLNLDREIQIGSKVYKYSEDGIFRVSEDRAFLLKDKYLLKKIARNATIQKIPSSNHIQSSIIANTIEFFPSQDTNNKLPHKKVSKNEANSIPLDNGITLKNGQYIAANMIRDVSYGSRGDDSGLNYFFTNIFGTNTVAINNFSSSKRMRVNFYDEDYLIRRVIGTKVLVQKKKFFIWWNSSADEIRQGWTNIEMKHTFPSNISQSFPKNPYMSNSNQIKTPQLPSFLKNKFPFEDEESVIFSVPFDLYNVTNNDLNSSFKAGLNYAASSIKSYFKSQSKKPVGIMSFEAPSFLYVAFDHNEKGPFTGSNETLFINDWFKGTYVVGFSYNEGFSLSNMDLSGETSLKFNRGAVYAAVRIGNTWKAARITKY